MACVVNDGHVEVDPEVERESVPHVFSEELEAVHEHLEEEENEVDEEGSEG